MLKKRDIKKIYAQAGHDLTVKLKNKEELNEQDEKEKENYRDHDYFVEILNSIDISNISTIEQHYKYLFLSLLTYQPPLRTSFYNTAKFLRAKDDNDKVNNFIWINRRGKLKVTIIVNRDKASNYKLYNMNKNLAFITIDNEKLGELINYSYEKYPREYLFELKNKAVSTTTLLNWLRSITGVDAINVDMMRSSYITWFHSHNHTLASKTKLSQQMRHSVDTAQRNYLKLVDVDPVEIENKNKSLQDQLILLQQKVKELTNKLNAYEKNDSDNEDDDKNDKLYKKRRSDVLYNLNKKGRSPNETTLNKYIIKYDDTKKLYY